MMTSVKEFSAKEFARATGADTWNLSPRIPSSLVELLDHGFIADRACIWCPELDGHEMAVVSRTYCTAAQIDTPPPGLRCVRLDWALGPNDLGNAVATVVEKMSDTADALLTLYQNVPAHMLAYALPLSMVQQGHLLHLETNHTADVSVGDCAVSIWLSPR